MSDVSSEVCVALLGCVVLKVEGCVVALKVFCSVEGRGLRRGIAAMKEMERERTVASGRR